jgi:hypothetical protein
MINFRILTIGFAVLFSLIAIVSGGILCWVSQKQTVCSDYVYQRPYTGETCDYVYKSFVALAVCNSTDVCYCMQPDYQLQCFATTPQGTSSVSFLIGGIVLIVIGIVAPIALCISVYMWK